LPALEIEVWSSSAPASTADLLRRVRSLGERERAPLMATQARAAEEAALAVRNDDASALLAALDAELHALDAWAAPLVRRS
jgi:hypothetical protein